MQLVMEADASTLGWACLYSPLYEIVVADNEHQVPRGQALKRTHLFKTERRRNLGYRS